MGEGSFLIAAHNAIEASDTDFLSKTSFTGYDLSEDAILIAMVRFFLLGTFNFHLTKEVLCMIPMNEISILNTML